MYVDSSEKEGLADALAAIPRDPDEHLMVLATLASAAEFEGLAEALHQRQVPAFGAAFPGIFADGVHHRTGAIGLPVPLQGEPRLFEEHDDPESLLEGVDTSGKDDTRLTAIMFYDAAAYEMTVLLRHVYDRWGQLACYLGSGAGSTRLESGRCIFAGRKTASRGALLALTRLQTTVALAHGWTPVAGPLVASRCEGKVVRELNWRPVLEVYRDILPRSLEIGDEEDMVRRIFPQYPLAVSEAAGEECVVRAPLAIDEHGGLVLGCSLPENSTLYVAQATPDDLLEAAGRVAGGSEGDEHIRYCLLVSGISRQTFLGESILDDELKLIQQRAGAPVFGVASLGEIASPGDRYFDIHNKAVALARVHA